MIVSVYFCLSLLCLQLQKDGAVWTDLSSHHRLWLGAIICPDDDDHSLWMEVLRDNNTQQLCASVPLQGWHHSSAALSARMHYPSHATCSHAHTQRYHLQLLRSQVKAPCHLIINMCVCSCLFGKVERWKLGEGLRHPSERGVSEQGDEKPTNDHIYHILILLIRWSPTLHDDSLLISKSERSWDYGS